MPIARSELPAPDLPTATELDDAGSGTRYPIVTVAELARIIQRSQIQDLPNWWEVIITAIVKLIQAVGISAFVGLLGIYLIICSIFGRLIAIPGHLQARSKLKRRELGFFGLVLAVPLIITIYRSQLTLFPQQIPDKVNSLDNSRSGGLMFAYYSKDLFDVEEGQSFKGPALLASQEVSSVNSLSNTAQVCQAVESFGLSETTFRRLKSRLFQGQAYVYVGGIHVGAPLKVYVFIGDPRSWKEAGQITEADFLGRSSAEIRMLAKGRLTEGASVEFRYSGHDYQLTVTRVFIVLFGKNQVAVSICERRAASFVTADSYVFLTDWVPGTLGLA